MRPEQQLFTVALGLEKPWEVRDINFEAESSRLDIKIDFDRASLFPCPECGKLCNLKDSKEKTWRHLNFFQHECYILHETPKTVTVTSNKVTTVEFTNKPYSGIQIIKTDSVTHTPLANATFKVESPNGEVIGTYKTDVSGKALISDLAEGTYIVSETIAPNGYILSEIPKTVIVKSGKLTTVEFANKALTGLKIIKLNAVTKAPIEGVEFTITKISGEKVQNDFRGNTFVTDRTGQIYINNLEDGYYSVTETKAAEGYSTNCSSSNNKIYCTGYISTSSSCVPSIFIFANRASST